MRLLLSGNPLGQLIQLCPAIHKLLQLLLELLLFGCKLLQPYRIAARLFHTLAYCS
ncbi:hypothetical protein D3C80_1882730 [compost metagenome]